MDRNGKREWNGYEYEDWNGVERDAKKGINRNGKCNGQELGRWKEEKSIGMGRTEWAEKGKKNDQE